MSTEIERTDNWDEKKLLADRITKREDVHIVEFINWQGYTVCNVQVKGVWYTRSFPATTTIIEFMMDGGISTVMNWSKGRIYQDT